MKCNVAMHLHEENLPLRHMCQIDIKHPPALRALATPSDCARIVQIMILFCR